MHAWHLRNMRYFSLDLCLHLYVLSPAPVFYRWCEPLPVSHWYVLLLLRRPFAHSQEWRIEKCIYWNDANGLNHEEGKLRRKFLKKIHTVYEPTGHGLSLSYNCKTELLGKRWDLMMQSYSDLHRAYCIHAVYHVTLVLTMLVWI